MRRVGLAAVAISLAVLWPIQNHYKAEAAKERLLAEAAAGPSLVERYGGYGQRPTSEEQDRADALRDRADRLDSRKQTVQTLRWLLAAGGAGLYLYYFRQRGHLSRPDWTRPT